MEYAASYGDLPFSSLHVYTLRRSVSTLFHVPPLKGHAALRKELCPAQSSCSMPQMVRDATRYGISYNLRGGARIFRTRHAATKTGYISAKGGIEKAENPFEPR